MINIVKLQNSIECKLYSIFRSADEPETYPEYLQERCEHYSRLQSNFFNLRVYALSNKFQDEVINHITDQLWMLDKDWAWHRKRLKRHQGGRQQ